MSSNEMANEILALAKKYRVRFWGWDSEAIIFDKLAADEDVELDWEEMSDDSIMLKTIKVPS